MRGELDFEDALRTRVALIKGIEREVIHEIRRERITLAPGSRTLVQTMKAYGAVTSLVSAVMEAHEGRVQLDEGPGEYGGYGSGLRVALVTPPATAARSRASRCARSPRRRWWI